MRRNFVLLFVLLFNLASVIAAGFESGKKYRIESNFDFNSYQRSGALGLGAFHDGSSTSFYVKDGKFTGDCWWNFEKQEDGTYLIKNAQTGEYMSAVKKWEDIKMIQAPSANAYWNLTNECGHIMLSVDLDEDLVLHFGNSHQDSEYATTDRLGMTIPYSLFNIYDENGNKVDATELEELTYCGTNAKIPARKSLLPKYANSIQVNGKMAFATFKDKGTTPSYWLASKPTNGKITIESDIVTEGASFCVMSGETPIENADNIETGKEYTLAVLINGAVSAKSTIIFTTMPIVDIRHEGILSAGMLKYVWGETSISSMEDSTTSVLSSRYKTRGATAANYIKHSMNMKLRNRDTDKDEDTTLLGLRSSSSWILDAMAIDRVNMRNRTCFDLWNQFSKLPYETKFDSRCGTVGKFVEVVENGEYKGIYCLTDRINRKLLDLKKPDTDSLTGAKSARGVLYKSGSWDYTGLSATEIDDYAKYYGDTRDAAYWCNWELTEPEDVPGEATWKPLYSLYMNEDNVQYYRDNFYINNVLDYHLFILALQITDNGNKNEFIGIQNIKKVGEDKARMFICPWDMDASLSGNFDGSALGGEYFTTKVENARINKNYPFSSLLLDSDYMKSMKSRWKDARTNVLSRKNLEEIMKGYASEFINSGAWAREIAVYGTMANNQSGCALVEDLNAEIDAICNWYDKQILRIDDFLGVWHVGYNNIPSSIEESNQIYDLLGRKLNSIPEKGLFIRGGKVNMITK